jgi:hypothetical protein
MLNRSIPGIKFPTPHLAHLDSIIFHAENYSFQVSPKTGTYTFLNFPEDEESKLLPNAGN